MIDYDDLLKRCAAGDIEACQSVASLIRGFAWEAIRQLQGDGFSVPDVDDAMSNIWVNAYSQIRKGNGPNGHALKSWTMVIAIRERANCIRRRLRDRKCFRSLESITDITDQSSSEMEIREKEKMIQLLRKVVEKFNGKDRQILEGVIRGNSRDESIAVTGQPLGTFKRHKNRVLAEAKQHLTELWERSDDEPLE